MTASVYLLGIDFGTGGCKISVIDAGGKLAASFSEEYPTLHPKPAWAEQNPADWYRVMCEVLKKLKHRRKVVAIALDSYTHGAVLLNRSLEVVRPTILWPSAAARCAGPILRAWRSCRQGVTMSTTWPRCTRICPPESE